MTMNTTSNYQAGETKMYYKSKDLSEEEMGLPTLTAASSSSSSSKSFNSKLAVTAITLLSVSSFVAISYRDILSPSALFSSKNDDEYEDANNGGSWGSNSEGNPHNIFGVDLQVLDLHSNDESNKVADGDVLNKCQAWISQYGIKPGKSWGKTPSSIQKQWALLECDNHLAFVDKDVDLDYPNVKAEHVPLQEYKVNEEIKESSNENESPSFLCSLEAPAEDEILNCEHTPTSFFVRGSQDGTWPAGFSWVLMSEPSGSTGRKKVVESQLGFFHQKDGLLCDTYVRKLCLDGDYSIFAHAREPAAEQLVEICDHTLRVKAGESMKFHINQFECYNAVRNIEPDLLALDFLAERHAELNPRFKKEAFALINNEKGVSHKKLSDDDNSVLAPHVQSDDLVQKSDKKSDDDSTGRGRSYLNDDDDETASTKSVNDDTENENSISSGNGGSSTISADDDDASKASKGSSHGDNALSDDDENTTTRPNQDNYKSDKKINDGAESSTDDEDPSTDDAMGTDQSNHNDSKSYKRSDDAYVNENSTGESGSPATVNDDETTSSSADDVHADNSTGEHRSSKKISKTSAESSAGDNSPSSNDKSNSAQSKQDDYEQEKPGNVKSTNDDYGRYQTKSEQNDDNQDDDESKQEAVPVKYSPRTIARKKKQLEVMDMKIKEEKDRIKVDRDVIKVDKSKIKRVNQDIDAEHELLKNFNEELTTDKQDIDNTETKLQKDEQDLQILFYQREQMQRDIDNPLPPLVDTDDARNEDGKSDKDLTQGEEKSGPGSNSTIVASDETGSNSTIVASDDINSGIVPNSTSIVPSPAPSQSTIGWTSPDIPGVSNSSDIEPTASPSFDSFEMLPGPSANDTATSSGNSTVGDDGMTPEEREKCKHAVFKFLCKRKSPGTSYVNLRSIPDYIKKSVSNVVLQKESGGLF